MSGAAFENLKVLLVEDNAQMRALLRNLLSAIGFQEVLEAPNGAAALALLRERKCDLILSDMAMHPMDGIAFTRAIRNGEAGANPFAPIIMVTGHTEKHRVEMARDAGVTEILAKPITIQNLHARLAEIVERPRAFIRSGTYFGPDRRRKTAATYAGPWRRADDHREYGAE
jgi:CheY-like chemotaxis protein